MRNIVTVGVIALTWHRSDYSKDGVHPNEVGYRVMAPLAEAAIAEALRKRP